MGPVLRRACIFLVLTGFFLLGIASTGALCAHCPSETGPDRGCVSCDASGIHAAPLAAPVITAGEPPPRVELVQLPAGETLFAAARQLEPARAPPAR